jgi:hypothetical protein
MLGRKRMLFMTKKKRMKKTNNRMLMKLTW